MKAWNRKRKPNHTSKCKFDKYFYYEQVNGKIERSESPSFVVNVKNIKQSFVCRKVGIDGVKLIVPRYNKESYLMWPGGENDI